MEVIISSLFEHCCTKLSGQTVINAFWGALENLKKDYCVSLLIGKLELIDGESGYVASVTNTNETESFKVSELVCKQGCRIHIVHKTKGSYFLELRPLNPKYFYDLFFVNVTVEKDGQDYSNNLLPNEMVIFRKKIVDDAIEIIKPR